MPTETNSESERAVALDSRATELRKLTVSTHLHMTAAMPDSKERGAGRTGKVSRYS
jgi:hypothetical protein